MLEGQPQSEAVPGGVRSGAVLADRYRIDEPLATGAMGAVFRGHDTLLDRPVAVKVLHPHLASSDYAERFVREGQTVAALSHPNLVGIYDMGNADGLPYLVMEFVKGEDLLALLSRNGPVSVATGVRLGLQICGGLAYAHEHGIIHRDIKPQNILVDPYERVEIVDFGIARGPQAAEMTAPGSVLGTADYLAPEVGAGEPASISSDLYSLGVVFYRLFTGRLPFEGDNPLSVAMLHRTAVPFPPSALRLGLPEAVEAIILRLLEKDPALRFPSATAVAEALAVVKNVPAPTSGVPRADLEATATLPARNV